MVDIAREWLCYANGGTLPKNDYSRFIAAYVALNSLYGYDDRYECDRMVDYLSSLCDRHRIDPFKFDVDEYLKSPIKDMRHGKNSAVEVTQGDYKSLFKAIYQVRCNLFHGNKSLGDERDNELVRQGAEVLIVVLNKALGKA